MYVKNEIPDVYLLLFWARFGSTPRLKKKTISILIYYSLYLYVIFNF